MRVLPDTAIQYFMRLSQLIVSKMPSFELPGEVEADESYFGGVGKGGLGPSSAGGKGVVFGLFKMSWKFFTAMIPNGRQIQIWSLSRRRLN